MDLKGAAVAKFLNGSPRCVSRFVLPPNRHILLRWDREASTMAAVLGRCAQPARSSWIESCHSKASIKRSILFRLFEPLGGVAHLGHAERRQTLKAREQIDPLTSSRLFCVPGGRLYIPVYRSIDRIMNPPNSYHSRSKLDHTQSGLWGRPAAASDPVQKSTETRSRLCVDRFRSFGSSGAPPGASL